VFRAGDTEDEARRTADVLTKNRVFAGLSADVQLRRVDDHYELRLIVKPEHRNDPNVVGYCHAVARLLSDQVFHGAACEAVFCDAKFEPLPP
jgi:hypothetical protein